MYLKKTITTIVVALMTIATANATIYPIDIPEPAIPGSGGGRGSWLPHPTSSMSQSFDFGGLHLNAYASNQEQNCYASINFWAEQGVNGRYYNYENGNSNFWTSSLDTSQFTYSLNATFRIVDEARFIPNPSLDIRQNLGMDLFGIHLNAYSQIENREYWEWEIGAEEPVCLITDDIELNGGFNLFPAQIDSINPDVRTWEWKNGNETLNLHFYINGHFLDTPIYTAQEIGAKFAPIPEPATIALLGFGTISLLRKRNHK